MTLTPADLHNVAFARALLGKRGYSEQEVDLFIDLVEEGLTRQIELHQLEADLAEQEAELIKHEAEVRQRDDRREAVASCVGAETANHHVQQLPAATQVKGPLSQPGAVNGTPRVEEMRAVGSWPP